MADDELTHFQFDFGGIKLEVSGDRDFVQEIYQNVMKDIDLARQCAHREPGTAGTGKDISTATPPEDASLQMDPSVWVHRCGDIMRKVYMASPQDVENSPLHSVLHPDKINNIYIEKRIFASIFPGLDNGQTLWAEFTAMGRQKIAEATQPLHKALQTSDSH